MARKHHPPPLLEPLQKVVVVDDPAADPSEGGVLGRHGVVLWRTTCYVETGQSEGSGWLYVVHLPGGDEYDCVEESRLVATGEDIPLRSCLGRGYEISYDSVRDAAAAIRGTFRVPGGFWNAFAFRCEDIEELHYQIRIPNRFFWGGIAKYDFALPGSVPLDRHCVEQAMSSLLGTTQWQRIDGPKSTWFD